MVLRSSVVELQQLGTSLFELRGNVSVVLHDALVIRQQLLLNESGKNLVIILVTTGAGICLYRNFSY